MAAETRWQPEPECLSTAPTDKHKAPPKPKKAKKPKKDTRKAAAKSAGVSERKVRQAQEVKKVELRETAFNMWLAC